MEEEKMEGVEDEDKERLPLWRKKLHRHLPITKWITTYKKEDIIADVISGLTLGLAMIPQSLAYAALAGLPTQYGLYSIIMGGFVYVFTGTIKEVSVGPTSLLSLLTFEFTKDLSIDFVCLLTFIGGCVELLLGIFRFGFLVDFISAPVIAGFQSSVSVIIISSQLKGIFGLRNIKSGKFFENLARVAKKIPETRFPDLILGVSTCVVLLLLRKLKDFSSGKGSGNKMKLKKFLWFISISRNTLVVFGCAVIAYFYEDNGQNTFIISGEIPAGLPPVRLPKFSTDFQNVTYTFPEMCKKIGSGIIIFPLVSVLANVTIAKAFSTGGTVDAIQEMLTLGLCNVAGSLIGSMPTSGAFTRSAISSSSGVRSPMSGLFSGIFIIIFLMFLAPYLYYIPKATLSAVLICAVMFMIDFKTCLLLWKANNSIKPRAFCFGFRTAASLTWLSMIGCIPAIIMKNYVHFMCFSCLIRLLNKSMTASVFVKRRFTRLKSFLAQEKFGLG